MTQETHILISATDAKTFRIFKEHLEKIAVLMQSGVFELDSGKVEINVNNGVIQNIHINRRAYAREKVLP